MRVASTPAPVVSRSSESKAAVATRPAVESNAAAQAKKPVLGHSPIDIGEFGSLVKPTADAKTRARQGEQLQDISDGVRDGSLTEKETQTLMKEQEAIANAQKAAMADGELSLLEKFKLAQMQQAAERNVEKARNNRERDVFAALDPDAQRQADQIEQIAKGRISGNITNTEAGKLLGQQAEIADARDNSGPLSRLLADMKQDQAQKDIALHSKPGTQIDWKPLPQPFPFPSPQPLPGPRPLPQPIPFPSIPSKPVPLTPYRDVING